MKLKLLLLFIGIVSMLGAQVPYDSTLIITEISSISGDFNNTYIELTNVGDKALDLADYKFVRSQGEQGFNCYPDYLDGRWVYPKDDYHFYLPESVSRVLEPGESYVMTIRLDYMLNGYKQGHPDFAYGDRNKNHNIYKYADFIADREEHGGLWDIYGDLVKDSAIYSPDSAFSNEDYVFVMGQLHLPHFGFFIEQHFLDDLGQEDSIVVDQNGMRFDRNPAGGDCRNNRDLFVDVAGVTEATRTAVLFRQKWVEKGNLDWNTARGTGLESSDWIAINYPDGWDNWRDYWWTVGNHANTVLDVNTLVPKAGENITVDFAAKKITVPWGVRRLDDIMRRMEYKQGVAWIHILNENPEDSLMRSMQSGDRLAIFCIGNTLTADTFDIEVNAPLASDNIVIPLDHRNTDPGPVTNNAQSGKLTWPRITMHGGTGVVDTITGAGRGLPYGMRIDTLYKYLEKAPNASFDLVFSDGETRADIKNSDKLVVTAENGDVKEYFLEVRNYEPSENFNLASITWPDISMNPLDRFKYDWPLTGDTIPGFLSSTLNYRVTLPPTTSSIPAFIAKPQNLNAKVTVDRAWTFNGAAEDRTTTFSVMAENDSVQVYSVEMRKELDRTNMQQWTDAEPFVSQYIHKTLNKNFYSEICNPGDDTLDLSYYMITYSDGSAIDAITQTVTADSSSWADQRYRKYIPGRRWLYYDEWAQTPNTVDSVPDPAVYSKVAPGDVFVLGFFGDDSHLVDMEDPVAYVNNLCDVLFTNAGKVIEGTYGEYTNTWNEPMGTNCGPFSRMTAKRAYYMFKILNDSVRHGQKPATDPDDFELVEVISMEDPSDKWEPNPDEGGAGQDDLQTRKPDIVFPNDIVQASFGTNAENSEWIYEDLGDGDELYAESQLGDHFFNPYTGHISTIKSPIYNVSPGYEDVSISGVLTGTLYEDFMANIYTINDDQLLVIRSGQDTLETGQTITADDTLIVVSADETNTTYYDISVSNEGLSNDAVLTSDPYDITVDSNTGAVAGMEFSTTLTDVVANVTVPDGAVMTVIDENNGFVPFRKLNIVGTYFDATANYATWLEVIAENKTTTITYQLQPTVADDTVFVLSDVYDVAQEVMLISQVPFGTSYATFLENLKPTPGAILQVFDKTGFERTSGDIAADDRLVVTSADGTKAVAYFLSLIDLAAGTEASGFLAYITSDVYVVNQVSFEVAGFSNQTTVELFLSSITPAQGATVVVTDADGNEKAPGDNMEEGDMVKVTSGNGETTVNYVIGILSGFESIPSMHISLYPNPTNSVLNIEGLNPGSRIQVYDVTGVKLRDYYSTDQHSVLSLDRETEGLYFVIINDKDNTPIGQYKVLKK